MDAGGMSIPYLGSLHRDNDWLDEGSSEIECSSNHRVGTAILRILRCMDTQLPFHHEPQDTSRQQGMCAHATDAMVQEPVGPAGHHNVAGPPAGDWTCSEL